MNINTAHCLLGHRKDSIRKIAKEMGWVLTRGVLKSFEHCVMAKAKQKICQKGVGSQKGIYTGTPSILRPIKGDCQVENFR
jgi:hypothetical protein